MTDDDIAHGRRGDALSCPIARAVSRTVGRSAAAIPGAIYIYDGRDWPCEKYAPDTIALQFMVDFDGGRPVKAFEFHMWFERAYERLCGPAMQELVTEEPELIGV